MTGQDILFGSERVSAASLVELPTATDPAFLAALARFIDEWPPLESRTDCVWALGQIFDAATSYVDSVGALPLDHPENVHRLLRNAATPGHVEELCFIECMPRNIKTWSYRIEQAEQAMHEGRPPAAFVSAFCSTLEEDFPPADEDQIDLTLLGVHRYLERIQLQLRKARK